MSLVSVIVPQFGQPALTVAAVSSLLRFHPDGVEVLIVDDGSPPAARRELLAGLRSSAICCSRVSVLTHARRRGVTAAWNTGAEHARGETLVFLNNDTVTGGAWVGRLVAALDRDRTLLAGAASRTEPDVPGWITGGETRLLAGWCFAIRPESLRAVGGFDSRLRMYYSDTDLQCRLLWNRVAVEDPLPGPLPQKGGGEARRSLAGMLAVVGQLPVRHLGHRSTRRLSEKSRLWREDRARFLRKWRFLADPPAAATPAGTR